MYAPRCSLPLVACLALSVAACTGAATESDLTTELVTTSFADAEAMSFITADGDVVAELYELESGDLLAAARVSLERGEAVVEIGAASHPVTLAELDDMSAGDVELERVNEGLYATWRRDVGADVLQSTCGSTRGYVATCINCCPTYACTLMCWLNYF